jgi:hypothetical protein
MEHLKPPPDHSEQYGVDIVFIIVVCGSAIPRFLLDSQGTVDLGP